MLGSQLPTVHQYNYDWLWSLYDANSVNHFWLEALNSRAFSGCSPLRAGRMDCMTHLPHLVDSGLMGVTTEMDKVQDMSRPQKYLALVGGLWVLYVPISLVHSKLISELPSKPGSWLLALRLNHQVGIARSTTWSTTSLTMFKSNIQYTNIYKP